MGLFGLLNVSAANKANSSGEQVCSIQKRDRKMQTQSAVGMECRMDQATHNKIVSFIWGIADDVLRDVFVRGKYRDVILPMCVLRRLDAVLEPTKKAVLETKEMLDKAGIVELHGK